MWRTYCTISYYIVVCYVCYTLFGSTRMIQVARQEGLNVEQNAAEILVEQVRTSDPSTRPNASCHFMRNSPCPALPCLALPCPKLPCLSCEQYTPLNSMQPLLFDLHPFSLYDIYYHIIPTRGIPPFSSLTRNVTYSPLCCTSPISMT